MTLSYSEELQYLREKLEVDCDGLEREQPVSAPFLIVAPSSSVLSSGSSLLTDQMRGPTHSPLAKTYGSLFLVR